MAMKSYSKKLRSLPPISLLLVVFVALTLIGNVSCNTIATSELFTVKLPSSFSKTTLEEAREIIPPKIPAPDYLPYNYRIQEVYVDFEHTSGNMPFPEEGSIYIFISDDEIKKTLVTYTVNSDTRQRYDVLCKMSLYISYSYNRILSETKAPGEPLTINGRKGRYRESEATHSIFILGDPHFELFLYASKDMPKEDLVKVAESLVI